MSKRQNENRNEIGDDPFEIFGRWYRQAAMLEPNDPNAMCLATVDGNGQPHGRMMLMKSYDENGFAFVTNYESDKGNDIARNPKAALLFHWKSTKRQVRIEGTLAKCPAEESDRMFNERPAMSRIASALSRQSRPLDSYERLMAEYEALGRGEPPQRPNRWGGYRLKPVRFEFWSDGLSRLHRRYRFEPKNGSWARTALYP